MREPDLNVRPFRHRLPVRGSIPTIRDARTDGTPSEISRANASRLAWSSSGPRRPIRSSHVLGCCDARQVRFGAYAVSAFPAISGRHPPDQPARQ